LVDGLDDIAFGLKKDLLFAGEGLDGGNAVETLDKEGLFFGVGYCLFLDHFPVWLGVDPDNHSRK
jgi:hypothetical protein